MRLSFNDLPVRKYNRVECSRKSERIHQRRENGPTLFPPYHLKSNRWFRHLFAMVRNINLSRLNVHLHRRQWPSKSS